MGVCRSLDQIPRVVPLFLGVVACTLAKTDDNWRCRLQALVLTLLCFAGALFAVALAGGIGELPARGDGAIPARQEQ